MKHCFTILSLTMIFIGCDHPAKAPGNKIRGKWSNITQQEGKTYEFIANFREDGSYDGILNGKVLVSGGNYKEHDDTISFKDPVCNIDYTGKYKLNYSGDSVRFQLIDDSCTVRRLGTDGVGMKRM